MSRVKLWEGDPTRRLTAILPASLALEMKMESLRRGVDVSVLAAEAFLRYLHPGPAPEPAGQVIQRNAGTLRRGRELVARLKAAVAAGQVTLAEFARRLARRIGHPNPVGLASAVRQWQGVPALHQDPVEQVLIQLESGPSPETRIKPDGGPAAPSKEP